MNKYWKIYFWIECVGNLVALIYFLTKPSLVLLDYLVIITGLVALYCYAYQKQIFTAMFWRTFFFVFVLFGIYQFATVGIPGHSVLIWVFVGVSFLVDVPLGVAVYMYAFKFLKRANETPISSQS